MTGMIRDLGDAFIFQICHMGCQASCMRSVALLWIALKFSTCIGC